MKKFKNIIKNPYRDRYITLSRLYNFAIYLKNQLEANNPNKVFEKTIRRLDEALTPLQPTMNNKDTAHVAQKGLTMALNFLISRFETAVHDHYFKIAAVFKPGSPDFTDFFPNGLGEYNQIRRKDTPTLMNRMKTATLQHSSKLPADLVASFENFDKEWTNSRASQLEAISETDDYTEILRLLKDKLAVACWKATGAVIDEFGEDDESTGGFFDPSLLWPPRKAKTKKQAAATLSA